MADGWYTHGPVPVYDARPGMTDKLQQNGTGGKAVLVKDGAPLPIRDLNGTPLAVDSITSNSDGQSNMFLVQARRCLVQFGDIVNVSWGAEVADELASQEQVLTAAQDAVSAAQQAVASAQQAVSNAQSVGSSAVPDNAVTTAKLASAAVTISKLADGIYPTGTAAARKMPYLDESGAYKWTAATAVVARALGWKIATDYNGVDPTGATTSRAGLDAAVTATPANGTLYLPDGVYDWPDVWTVAKAGIAITGPSATLRGKLKIGDGTSRKAYTPERADIAAAIHHITFRRELDKVAYPATTGANAHGAKGYADDSYFIGIDCARDVEITGVHFYGAAWPVYVMPSPLADQHDISSVNVHHNFFAECDWAFYATFDPAAPAGWQCFADSNFESNVVNRSYVGGVYAKGVDGMHVEGNTFFMLNYGSNGNPRWQEKRRNVWFEQSDWVHINHNGMFEAGEEAVFLDRTRRAELIGNQFAWAGQRVPSDAVRIISNSGGAYATSEYATLAFVGNDGTYYSKSLLSLLGDFGGIACGPNTCLFKSDADRFIGTPGQFTGTSAQIQASRRAALTALPHYRYDMQAVTGLTASQISIVDAVLTRTDSGVPAHYDRLPNHTLTTSVQSLGPYAVVGGATVTPAAFTALTAQSVANLRGAADNSGAFGGEVLIVARTTSGSNKESTYKLLLNKTKDNVLNVLDVSGGGLGYTAGAAADDPSFAWSISTGAIIATPIGSTAGTFSFAFTFSGNLIVG